MKKKSHNTSTTDSTPLSQEDRQFLEVCEEAIETGHPCIARMMDGSGKMSDRWAYLSIGEGLFTIYQYALYREAFDSFEQYCQTRWGMPQVNARRFICMFQVVILALSEPKVMDIWKYKDKA